MKKKIMGSLLAVCLLVGSSIGVSANTLYSPGPGFPLADGIDISRSYTSYNSPSFSTGVYVGGESPRIFDLNSSGYAQYSSVYQAPIDSSASISISYQTINAATGSVLAGKTLSGINSSAKVTLTTKVQANKDVNAYLRNNSNTAVRASGNFNY